MYAPAICAVHPRRERDDTLLCPFGSGVGEGACARLDLQDFHDCFQRGFGLDHLLLAEEEVLADLLLAAAGVVLAKRGPAQA